MKTLQNNFWQVLVMVLGVVLLIENGGAVIRWYQSNPTAAHIIEQTVVTLVTAVVIAYAAYTARQEMQSRPTHK